MKADLPIIGQDSPTNSLLTTSLVLAEIRRIDENAKAWEMRMKIAELRKSCGITDKIGYTVNIRRPPRYIGTFK